MTSPGLRYQVTVAFRQGYGETFTARSSALDYAEQQLQKLLAEKRANRLRLNRRRSFGSEGGSCEMTASSAAVIRRRAHCIALQTHRSFFHFTHTFIRRVP